MSRATDYNFQPLERGSHAAIAIATMERGTPAAKASEPWASADPTRGAPDRTDAMLDAIERITERRECGCWIGASCCAVCR